MKKLATFASAAVLAAAAGQASADVYQLTGSFDVPVLTWNIPFTIESGTYDTDNTWVDGQSNVVNGMWNVTAELEAGGIAGGGTINFDQTFLVDSTTGSGEFFAPTNCTGNANSCSGLGPNFVGTASANPLPIDSPGTYTFTVNTGFGPVNFQPTLVPVPAAAWLFGSAVLGLAGIGRHRKAA